MVEGSLILLIFDPGKHQMKKFQSSTDAGSLMYLVRNNIGSLKAKQYQILSVHGLISDPQDHKASGHSPQSPVIANFALS